MFAHIRGRAEAFEISVQVPAGATVLAWLAGTVIHIYRETNHTVKHKAYWSTIIGRPESRSQLVRSVSEDHMSCLRDEV